jgi:heme exporter protein A
VLRARDLGRRFGSRWAFARVDLELQPGERLLLAGGNGSGKTTLLRVLSTLLSPTRGALEHFGAPAGADPTAARRQLALLSHAPGLYEDLSGIDNLRVFARLLGASEPLPPLLERVGLDPARAEPVRAWSAGMRKRLQIGLVLMQRPRLVLLDEPFASLDPRGFDQLSALIRELPGTVVLASHQLTMAGALCDRALLLDAGLPRWEGPAVDVGRAWKAVHGGAA